MKYTATITIEGDVFAYLQNDIRQHKRSQMTLEPTDRGVIVHITAKDAVALRSCFNTIGQAMVIWEQS